MPGKNGSQLFPILNNHTQEQSACHAGSAGCSTGCERDQRPSSLDRRSMLKNLAGALLSGAGMMALGAQSAFGNDEERKSWLSMFQRNFRLMTDREKHDTIARLERRYEEQLQKQISIRATPAVKGTLFGYAFNISKCRGYMDCVKACIQENNLDRRSGMQYIKLFEHKKGTMDLSHADPNFYHEVPVEGHYYFGVQCFQCDNPPCVPVCPVGATWKEPDGIVVVDYDWCIGCRYCEAACPYFARRFNWADPQVPAEEVNPDQHYLGNRLRKKGVVEKCTYCIQRSRHGENPACVEACPTGARIFGNLLDPDSEIRWVLANKKVFRLKEDLGTEPKFWYFMD